MVETSTVFSHWRKKHFGIHGWNVHQKATEKQTTQWFVYCVAECLPCQAQYVGSSTNIPAWWKQHKSTANTKKASCSGISKHFSEKLTAAGHIPGPQCRCSECARLKSVEDDWILKLGTFFASKSECPVVTLKSQDDGDSGNWGLSHLVIVMFTLCTEVIT